MKILHMLDIPWWSGLSFYAQECVEAHISLGHDVQYLCVPNTLPWVKAAEKKIVLSKLQGRKAWHSIYNFFKTGHVFFHWKPDVVVVHTGSTHWIALFWSIIFGMNIIRTRATAQKLKYSFLSRLIYSRTKIVVAASQHLSDMYQEFFHMKNICTIYPPILPLDINFKSQNLLRSEELFKNKNFFRVGVCARLDPVKGPLTILKAMASLQNKIPNVELHWAGSEEGISWRQIQTYAIKYGMKHLKYHGFLDSYSINEFMKFCDVGLIASNNSEEVARAVQEWMSQGKPVVSTSVGCIPEFINDGEGGFLVKPQDNIQMAESIYKLLCDESLRNKMGEQNITSVKQKFSYEKFYDSWNTILLACTNKSIDH